MAATRVSNKQIAELISKQNKMLEELMQNGGTLQDAADLGLVGATPVKEKVEPRYPRTRKVIKTEYGQDIVAQETLFTAKDGSNHMMYSITGPGMKPLSFSVRKAAAVCALADDIREWLRNK